MASSTADIDDDVIPDAQEEPKYPWFSRPAPGIAVTFTLASFFFVVSFIFYQMRVNRLKTKFGPEQFRGSLRVAAKISAYMDNYGVPQFAILRLCTKSFFFLGFLQINYHMGFWIMWGVLGVESSLDTIRVLLAYRNCRSLEKVKATSEEEARDMRAGTQLQPTNVYEDLTRPKSIAVMVFLVQGILIGLVMDDTYRTTTRTCFDGTDGCLMLASFGSYSLYLLGTFMACVFYVGPRNSYGQKEQNPTFWLKLFLMSKETKSVFSWKDPVTDQTKTIHLAKDDARIWLRFVMSFLINGVGFHFLLHVLPIQVAMQSAIIGVVFRAVGMIYLADLDDSAGCTLTLVPEYERDEERGTVEDTYGSSSAAGETKSQLLDEKVLEEEKQKIIDEAMKDVQTKLEALVHSGGRQKQSSSLQMESITSALFLSTQKRKKKKSRDADEETPLVK